MQKLPRGSSDYQKQHSYKKNLLDHYDKDYKEIAPPQKGGEGESHWEVNGERDSLGTGWG